MLQERLKQLVDEKKLYVDQIKEKLDLQKELRIRQIVNNGEPLTKKFKKQGIHQHIKERVLLRSRPYGHPIGTFRLVCLLDRQDQQNFSFT